MSSISQTSPPPSPADPIPAALRRLPQWVVWRECREPGRARLRKRPFSPKTLYPTAPASARRHEWASYEQARRILAQGAAGGPPFDGLGFVFTAADPYCAIDLDDCIDDQGRLEPYAAYQVRRLASYTEITVSGHGLHIILAGTLPGAGRHPSDATMELYDRDRFFVMSGNPWPDTPPVIAQRQDQISELWWGLAPPASPAARSPAGGSPLPVRPDKTDEQILALLRRSALGSAFADLYDQGDLGRYGGNRSSADLALANMIAFYSPSPAQVERLMRGSRLVRPKWEERRPGGTYLSVTIARAANRATVYTGKPSHSTARPPLAHASPVVKSKEINHAQST